MMRSRLGILTVALAVVVPAFTRAAPALQAIKASRTDGVAPLAVLFDATATTDPDSPQPFHSLRYEWTFGDPKSGNWSLSQRSRDRAAGAVAGHVFERAGAYTVSLRITSPSGAMLERKVVVSVASPDEYFSPELTFCYATSGTPGGSGFEACPVKTASQHIVGDDFNRALYGRIRTKSRHLFRSGDRFTQRAGLSSSIRGPVLIGSFGAGPKPVIQSRLKRTDRVLEARDDWRYVGLRLEGDGGLALSRPADSRVNVSNVLFLGMEAVGFGKCAEFDNESNRSGGFHRHLAIVDFSCKGLKGEPRGRAFFDRSYGSMFLGLDIDLTGTMYTLFRTVYMNTSVLEHSRLRGGPGGSLLALRACGQDNGGGCRSGGVPNQFVVVSDNEFIEGGTNAPIRTCLHSECDREGTNGNQVADILFERNFFTFDFGKGARKAPNARYLQLQGADITVRNNVFDMSGSPPWQLDIVQADPSGPSDRGKMRRENIRVEQNTVFVDASTKLPELTVCRSFGGSGHRCLNNLLYAPGLPSARMSNGGGFSDSGNLIAKGGSPFATAYPGRKKSKPTDFALAAGSSAIDAGVDLRKLPPADFVGDDFLQRCRPSQKGWDAGAFEFGAKPCP